MSQGSVKCVLLADRHHGLCEGVRSLLETVFEAVVMVADENSLLESARCLQPTLAVVDLSIARSDGFIVKRLLATELLPAVDALLAGGHHISAGLAGYAPQERGSCD